MSERLVNDPSEWDQALSLAGSENRGGVLLEACQRSTVPTARKLLSEWFNLCDALKPWATGLREQFERVGYVSDTKEKFPFEFPLTIYRAAWDDDDLDLALSWTTDLEFAKRFCQGLTSFRARFLGYYREDATAMVFQATCYDALGYFTDRNESEIVPTAIFDPEPIMKLVRLPADAEV